MRDQLIKKQNGMILPVVLIFFSVLMLLGVTIVSVSGNQVSGSMSQVNRSQAYYLAKSGAETFADYLIEESDTKNYEDMKKLIDALVDKDTSKVKIEDGELEIEVNSNPEVVKRYLDIISSVVYKGENAKAVVRLDFKHVVENINTSVPALKGIGVVLINSSLEQKNKTDIKGSILEKQSKEVYPDPVFPMDIVLPTRADLSGGLINEDGYYKKINVTTSNKLIIDLKNSTRIVRVEELTINGSIELLNEGSNGKLILFVDKVLQFGQTGNTNINEHGNPNSLMIYYAGSNTVTLNNHTNMNAMLYAPNMKLDTKNSAKIKGTIVVKELLVKNKTEIDGTSSNYTIPDSYIGTTKASYEIGFGDNPWGLEN